MWEDAANYRQTGAPQDMQIGANLAASAQRMPRSAGAAGCEPPRWCRSCYGIARRPAAARGPRAPGAGLQSDRGWPLGHLGVKEDIRSGLDTAGHVVLSNH